MRSLLATVLVALFSLPASALPKSLSCSFDFDSTLILKLEGAMLADQSIQLRQLGLFEKIESAEDTNLLLNYRGPTAVKMEETTDLSWKFEVPSANGALVNLYTLYLPADYAKRLVVDTALQIGGKTGTGVFQSEEPLQGGCSFIE